MSTRARVSATLAALMVLLPCASRAQIARDSSVDWLVSAGSEAENYLRVLQVAGLAPITPWSIRPFSARMLREIAPADTGHPWASQFRVRPKTGAFGLKFVQPEAIGILNTTFPYGYNDGPIWAGRGVTLAASGGVRGEYGPLSFTIAPQVFLAQNASFSLAPTGFDGRGIYADPAFPGTIDLPQRFGSNRYSRGDFGQSVAQLHLVHLAAGVASANELWGPAITSPLLLGTNAAGFPRVFIGSDDAIKLGFAKVAFRVIAGQLQQSSYSPVDGHGRRYLAGAIANLRLAQVPGLEIGIARIFENEWPDSGLSISEVLRPLVKNPFKARLARKIGNNGNEPDNQIASLFARWLLPRSRFEFYGELAREDNAYDTRDLIAEPDHDIAYMLGLQRVWIRNPGELLAFRAEIVNAALSHLAAVRPQTPFYVHTFIRQGHTQRGQLIGSPSVFGGGGGEVALDWYSRRGRRTISWRRMVREPATSSVNKRDVIQALSLEWISFHEHFDLKPELTLAYNLNRDSQRDLVNARAAVTMSAHW